MRRLVRTLVTIALTFVAMALTATAAHADGGGGTCAKYGPGGVCIIWVSGGGSGGGGSGGGGGGSGGGGGASGGGGGGGCHWDTGNGHAPGVVPCTADGAVWNGYCYLKLMDPQPPQGVAGGGIWDGHADGAIYVCSAPGPGESPIGIVGLEFWFARPPAGLGPDPGQLAQQALRTLTIPSPTPGRYPAGTLKDGRPYTVVGPAYTWYYTDPGTFQALTATASAGGVSSTVTVTPSALLFTPGDGASAVSCRGPGVAWTQSDGPWAASSAGCDYQYPHSSIHDPNGEVTATYGIDWTINWTSNVGGGGTLPDLTTTATATFAVAEVESVVTR
jgi:hypothetical protein